MKIADIITLLVIVGQNGVPAVMDIIKTWKKDEISLADIQNLLLNVKNPEEFVAKS